MSVLIKGMEMPEHCGECGIEFCTKWINHDARTRPKDCPLRPLPEKHGRLADIDAMIEEIKVGGEEAEREANADGVLKPGSSLVVALLIAYLDGRPAIVEAEGD